MSDGKTVFYMVNITHMIGENGIAALLSQSGYNVERITS
jgi:uncharacterized protein YbaP (TraB family)